MNMTRSLFSRANLMYMRAFAEAWPDAEIVQQLVGQLPWGHNLVLLSKLKNEENRKRYAERAIEYRDAKTSLTVIRPLLFNRIIHFANQATP